MPFFINEPLLNEDKDDFDVYDAESGEYLGSIELLQDATADQMPNSLEINGVEYFARK
jgi:hypothetical protein